ncbi:unnamed protein product [Triticum turgidum subsp. durum]|uniref:sucrose synthase n=1 Tax=Triticum turgidum subsp. durum TaxID=4567 RepID=A0A9R0V435_TRITD|nr:unnamed protein product [Triticum turgidum subsp. durum]
MDEHKTSPESLLFVFLRARDDNSLEVDFGALDLSTPHLTPPSSIGNGMQFVSRIMSWKLSGKPESMKPLLDYPGESHSIASRTSLGRQP